MAGFAASFCHVKQQSDYTWIFVFMSNQTRCSDLIGFGWETGWRQRSCQGEAGDLQGILFSRSLKKLPMAAATGSTVLLVGVKVVEMMVTGGATEADTLDIG